MLAITPSTALRVAHFFVRFDGFWTVLQADCCCEKGRVAFDGNFAWVKP